MDVKMILNPRQEIWVDIIMEDTWVEIMIMIMEDTWVEIMAMREGMKVDMEVDTWADMMMVDMMMIDRFAIPDTIECSK